MGRPSYPRHSPTFPSIAPPRDATTSTNPPPTTNTSNSNTGIAPQLSVRRSPRWEASTSSNAPEITAPPPVSTPVAENMPRRSERIANKKIASETTPVKSILKKHKKHKQKDRPHHKHIQFPPDNKLCKVLTIETNPKRHLKTVPPIPNHFLDV